MRALSCDPDQGHDRGGRWIAFLATIIDHASPMRCRPAYLRNRGRAAAGQQLYPHEATRDTTRQHNDRGATACEARLLGGHPAGVPRWHARGQAFKSPQLHQAFRIGRSPAQGLLSADCQQITFCDVWEGADPKICNGLGLQEFEKNFHDKIRVRMDDLTKELHRELFGVM
jgi:hypothetical protein